MKNTLLIAAALLLFSGPALALGDKTTSNSKSNASSSSSAAAVSGSASSSGVYGSGNSHAQGGDGGTGVGFGGQGGDAGAIAGSNSGGNSLTSKNNIEGDDNDVDVYNPGAASAAGNNVWACSQSWNVEARSFLAGVAVGIPQSDEVCEAGQLLDQAILVNKHVEMPHLIVQAAENLRMLLQKRVGYKATVEAIKSEGTGNTYTHAARPAHCYNADGEVEARFGMSDSDKLDCGLI